MNDSELTNALYGKLENQNYKGKVVSIEHIQELKAHIERPYKTGSIDGELYRRELIHFDFDLVGNFKMAKTLIIVAVPQPHVRVMFYPNGKPFSCLVPSNYSHITDERAQNIIESHLKSGDYRIKKVKLPLKALAVQSGLGQYGRNNIAYVKGMGSFFRLVVFVSDLPCSEDNWGEFKIMDRCETCTICQKMCPTGAIPSDRFLLRAERCLCFFSEWPGDFPDWLNPAWHHCLVGCLICQKTCPVDKIYVDNIEEGPTFSPGETYLILTDVPVSQLPEKTKKKLNDLGISEYIGLLGRNLQILIKNKKIY